MPPPYNFTSLSPKYLIMRELHYFLTLQYLIYSSPQFSPAFSEPPHSPWVSSQGGDVDSSGLGGLSGDGSQPAPVQVKNVRNNTERMEADEALGKGATISAVLYANINHPEWKKEYPGICFVISSFNF